MLKFLADENFDRDIVRGLLLRDPTVDIIRVQEVGLSEADDQTILEWAAVNQRIVLTHDIKTMIKYAYARIDTEQSMPGVFAISQTAPIGQVIADLLLLAVWSDAEEWEGQVKYLPLK
jgi:hypothetical protein